MAEYNEKQIELELTSFLFKNAHVDSTIGETQAMVDDIMDIIRNRIESYKNLTSQEDILKTILQSLTMNSDGFRTNLKGLLGI